MSYALEKLGEIYYRLAIGEDEIRIRLANIEVEFMLIFDRDIPDELQNEWKYLKSKLTERGPYVRFDGVIERGPLQNTVKRMRKKTASNYANLLVQFYFKLKAFE